MKKSHLTMLGLPLILGSMTLMHAPAAQEENTGDSPEISSRSDPSPAVSSIGEGTQDALLFKTTRQPNPPLPQLDHLSSNSGSRLESSISENTTTSLAADKGRQFPTLKSDFLNAAIPQEFPFAPPPVGLPEGFTELSGITNYTALRQKGPFAYALKLNTSAVYDDNVSLKKTDKRRALQMGIGPAARVFLGSDESSLRLGATYAGTAMSFSDRPRDKAYDQNLGFGAEWSGSRLRLAINTGLQSSHNSSLDAGERVGRKVYYAGGTASYEVTGKTSADLSADLTRANFNTLLSSTEYRTQQFLNYQWSPKMQWGLGATQGLTDAENTPRQTYLQGLVRVIARLTDKTGINASVGNEWRHYDSGQPATTAPVFSASAVWQATGKTTFSADLRRRTFASAASVSQNYESTSTTISAHEMLTATVNASLSMGMERAHYSASSPGIQADREDKYLFSRIALEWFVSRNCTLGTFYESGHNDSTGSQGESFRRNRIGLSLKLNF